MAGNGQAPGQAVPGNAFQPDPRMLLNPKGNSSSHRHHTSSATSANPQNGEKRPFPKRNPYEEIYGVEARTEPPKKARLDSMSQAEANGIGKKTSMHHDSNGIVGAYMKEPQADTERQSKKSIDLTYDSVSDEADEEVIITGTRAVPPSMTEASTPDYEEVCLGRVDLRINVFRIPSARTKSIFQNDSIWPMLSCQLSRDISAKDKRITVLDPTNQAFANVQADMAPVFTALMDRPEMKVRFQVRLMSRTRKAGEQEGQSTSQIMTLITNVYCPKHHGSLINKHLGSRNIWLSAPFNPDLQKAYFNPYDAIRNRGLLASGASSASHVYSQNRTVEEASDAVNKMFDSLTSTAENIPEMEPDPDIMTPLLPHQKQALHFMTEREKPRRYGTEDKENSSLWRLKYKPNGQKLYSEIVSGIEQTEEPAEVFGGLLADMMGLGKTIEMLSLMATTKRDAEKFAEENLVPTTEADSQYRCHSKATLLIAPLSTIQNWESQVREHVKPGALSTYVYHGSNRSSNAYELANNYDLIVTTYGTALSDSSKPNSTGLGGPLFQIKWFRIVLDEAHTIRESKTNQSQAIYRLWATRRWAVTGTPIQNRIDDLGSLLFFLRLTPYDKPHGFTQYVKNPLKSRKPSVLTSLRVLVDSICLRRLKDSVHLTKRTDQVVKLDFTPEEAKLHDFFRKESRAEVAKMKEKETGNAKNLTVLQGILTLRMISAHGRDLLNERDRQRLKGMSQTEAIDLDDDKPRPMFTEHSAYETVALMQEAGMDICRQCNKRLADESPREEAGGPRGYVFSCYDLVCKDCFQGMQPKFAEAAEDQEKIPCPTCQLPIQTTYIPITVSGLEEFLLAQESTASPSTSRSKRHSSKSTSYSGPSTKTRALLNDISDMYIESIPLIENDEAPLKCVIFSEFTSHLDLISRALSDLTYSHTRIDGTMSLSARRSVLNSFSTDRSITILLASIKAAGQGLNLTAASRAFIMEPLWNPAAEQQAVDRIHRLGQTREVFVTRYVINDSVEESIVKLQKKKQMLADVSLNRKMKGRGKEAREEMGRLLEDLFK